MGYRVNPISGVECWKALRGGETGSRTHESYFGLRHPTWMATPAPAILPTRKKQIISRKSLQSMGFLEALLGTALPV